jgi:hypothetical protein
MVRPTITALDDYKDFILRERSSGTSIPRIKNRLEREHGLPVSVRTLKSRLREWDTPTRRVVIEVVPGLEETLQELFYQLCPSDAQLVDLLTERGYTVSLHGVRTLWRSMKIFRRQDPEQIEQRLEELRQFFETSSTSTPMLPRLGRRALYIHVRQVANIDIPEGPLYAAATQMFPREVKERWRR